MPILTIDYDIIYYVESNSVFEMNNQFLGSDLDGNKKMYQISDINPLKFNKYCPDGKKTYSTEDLRKIQSELKEDYRSRKDIEGLHGFPMVMKL